jgi:hypothetical protein
VPIELFNALASLGTGALLGGVAIWFLNQAHVSAQKRFDELYQEQLRLEQKHAVTLEAMYVRSEKTSDRMLAVIEANTRAWEKVSVALDNISAATLKEVGDRLERLERRERP